MNTDGWSSVVGNIIAKPLLKDAEGKEPISVTAKRPESQIKGYNSDMFYPSPYAIKVNNQKGLSAQLDQILSNDAGYFTRENFKYAISGGIRKVINYQDIDLSDITDYISGRVYGVGGVKAVVGCYIGNGITRYQYTERAIKISDRLSPNIYDQTEPRISGVNFRKAGQGLVGETIKVVIQELADEELLKTKVYDPTTDKVVDVNNITFIDPVTKAIQKASTSNIKPYNAIINAYRSLYNKATNYYNANKSLTKEPYFSNGQYVEYNIGYIDSLNKRTTKIRIYLIFDVADIRLYETLGEFTNNEELYDINSWERYYVNDTYEESPDGYILSKLRNDNPNVDISKLIATNAESRGLVTGLNVSLYPLTPTNKLTVSSNNAMFAKGIIKI